MELLSHAAEYLRVSEDDFSSQPSSISIFYENRETESEYAVSGYFPGQEDADDIMPPKRTVSVSKESSLHQLIYDTFVSIKESVEVASEAEIESISINETNSKSEIPENWPFYTSEIADARVFIGVTRNMIRNETKEQLYEVILDELSELDPDVSLSEIKNAEFLFSDMDICSLQTVRGDVETMRPHLYYSNVDSVEDYLEKSNSSEEQEPYEVFYRLADSSTVPDDSVQNIAEDVMWDFIEESLSTDWEYCIEAESIYFGEFEDDDLVNESINYWVNIPIVSNEIGVTK